MVEAEFQVDTAQREHEQHGRGDEKSCPPARRRREAPLRQVTEQHHQGHPQAERGRVMATINFFSFMAILFASGVLWFLSNVFQQNPAQVFFLLGVASLAVVSAVYLNKYGLTYFKRT